MRLFLPKINLTTIRRGIATLAILVLTFSVGYLFGSNGFKAQVGNFPQVTINREVPADKGTLDFSLFWRVWDTLGQKYFDKGKLVPSQMVYGAIKGMVESIGDPYTVFLSPKENKVVQEDLSGAFEGVGIQIGFKGSQLAVIAPLPGSPAEKTGVKAGDFIVGIKDAAKKLDRGTVGISLPEAVQAIRGQAGTKVTLILTREGVSEPITVEITRAKLEVPSVILKFVGPENSIAHLKLLKFGAETNGEWDKAVREINVKCQMSNVKCAVILDLRNNPGGYLQGAVDFASEFLKVGSVVVIEEHANGTRNEFKVEKAGRLTNTAVVVLVNEGSASASEILAGALRDERKVKLVGEKTFGKGTIQEPLQLEMGAGLHITTARWLTPSGFWVNEKGLEPDVKIKDDEKTPQDEQLQKAIEVLTQ